MSRDLVTPPRTPRQVKPSLEDVHQGSKVADPTGLFHLSNLDLLMPSV
jgi:hypothetical protein